MAAATNIYIYSKLVTIGAKIGSNLNKLTKCRSDLKCIVTNITTYSAIDIEMNTIEHMKNIFNLFLVSFQSSSGDSNISVYFDLSY